jgi:hypothetical protein
LTVVAPASQIINAHANRHSELKNNRLIVLLFYFPDGLTNATRPHG